MNGEMVNLSIMVLYLLGTLAIGVLMSKYVKSTEDFFLAGRSLNHLAIAGTIVATNIAAVFLVGPAGGAYKGGASVLIIAWSGNMIAAASALLFVPRYRRLRLMTIPEIVETRYGVGIRLLPAFIWMIYYSLFAGTALYTFSLTMQSVLGWNIQTIILTLGPLVIVYCFAAGLMAVVFTSVLQTFLIIIGGIILLPLSLKAVGGIDAFVHAIPPEKFAIWPTGGSPMSWKDISMWIILGLPYWCTSQYMLQRTFAGKSVRDSARGLAFAGLITGPITLSYIIPGICGSILYSGPHKLANPDMVLPQLLKDVLPIGLGGLFIAALVAASNSTASSLLNSIATIFENDVYRRFKPNLREKQYALMARVATLGAGVIAIAFALLASKYSILQTIYGIMGFFEPPLFVIIAGAIFWKRPSPTAAGVTVICGIFGNLAGLLFGMSGADVCLVGFVNCAIVFIISSYVFPNTRVEETEEMMRRIEKKKAPTPTMTTRVGWGVAILALWMFIVCAIGEAYLPKPANLLIFMGLAMAFILGIYFAIPGLVAEEDLTAEEQRDIEDRRRHIDESLINRVMSSWITWVAVYAFAIVLCVALYVL